MAEEQSLPSQNAVETHNTALYVDKCYKFRYNPNTGTAVIKHVAMEKAIEGTPGEVMTDKEFFIPNFEDSMRSRIDLAFELGFLIGRQTKDKMETLMPETPNYGLLSNPDLAEEAAKVLLREYHWRRTSGPAGVRTVRTATVLSRFLNNGGVGEEPDQSMTPEDTKNHEACIAEYARRLVPALNNRFNLGIVMAQESSEANNG